MPMPLLHSKSSRKSLLT